ncbi:MAG: sulfatase-like hydrolase/transferase [Candidatus Sumerlaeota bacterium]|nr:sulfatase-like hydrolase/transferase [Candidatus Sumerlaeota bacterium]
MGVTRRDFLRYTACGSGILAGEMIAGGPWAAVAGEGQTQNKRGNAAHPNILVILADQWNPYCLGCAGAKDVKTPNLDALAGEGASFSACYTTSPVCMPARTGIVSGLYPHNLGLWNNSTTYYAPPDQTTLFADMKRAGYETAQIGKLHWFNSGKLKGAFADTREYFQAMGLDVAESMGVDGGGAFEQRVKELGRWDVYHKDMEQRYLEDQYAPRPSLLSPEDHCDSIVAQRAIEHLQSRPAGKPWFTVVSFSGPHPPLDAPGRYATMYDLAAVTLAPTFAAPMKYGGQEYDEAAMRRMKANYLGKMSLINDRIGEIVEAVKSRGEWDNTLVIFACDHGEMMGAHNCLSKGRFYEESARVPLIVRWPGTVAAETTIAAPVQLFDIYPTIVEAAGGAMTPGRFAQSLLPLFQGAEETRPAVFSEISNKEELRYMVRTRRLKWFVADKEEHLYDMEADPYETKNLADDAAYKNEIEAMRARLLDFLMKSQFNISAGYVPKVQRMRQAQAKSAAGAVTP